ncbi:MAG TPA: hypothetical protein GXZ65_04255 [Clostridiales bacterium]|nr:hypothetical protein [Clostridiales bacterium]
MTKLLRGISIYAIGALGYGVIELLFRGYTHWSMLLAGGVCFCLMYKISDMPVPKWQKWVLGASVITTVEFVAGAIVNIWLKWRVWDYSGHIFNLFGQICLLFTFLWFLLCIPAMELCRILRSYLNRIKILSPAPQDGSSQDDPRPAI